MVNGIECYTFKSSTKLTRIKFYDDNLETTGAQNKFLPEEINKKTINFSEIHSFYLVTLNCNIIELHQNYYEIYNEFDDTIIFTS